MSASRYKDPQDHLLGMIQEGEHEHQDFKFEISDTYKIAKTLSAFANTGGGRLLIGVKDNGRIAGVRSQEEAYMIEAAAQRCCVGQVDYTLRDVIVDGKTVLVADIGESKVKPVLALDNSQGQWAYVRVKDENILASPVHLALWKQQNDPDGQLTAISEGEQALIRQIAGAPEGLTLNQACHLSTLSRRRLISLMARLVRYQMVSIRHTERGFVFQSASD